MVNEYEMKSGFFTSSILVVLISLFPGISHAQPIHPPIYIDKGACPFECCAYGPWKTEKETVLFAWPDKKSERIGKCVAGSPVIALTGEVHTVAGRFLVKRTWKKYKPGDILWVYTYTGEGNFKVWDDGRFVEMQLGFSPYGGSSGSRCEVEKECWGELDKKLEMTWWVKIKNADGVIGWTDEWDHFSGADLCG